MSEKTTPKAIDFGAGLKELEGITAWFESDDIDLDQALAKFERGMELASQLKAQLTNFENRVQKIKAKFDEPVTDPVPAVEEPPVGGDDELGLFGG